MGDGHAERALAEGSFQLRRGRITADMHVPTNAGTLTSLLNNTYIPHALRLRFGGEDLVTVSSSHASFEHYLDGIGGCEELLSESHAPSLYFSASSAMR